MRKAIVCAVITLINKNVALFRPLTIIQINNTPHASRQICAPGGLLVSGVAA